MCEHECKYFYFVLRDSCQKYSIGITNYSKWISEISLQIRELSCFFYCIHFYHIIYLLVKKGEYAANSGILLQGGFVAQSINWRNSSWKSKAFLSLCMPSFSNFLILICKPLVIRFFLIHNRAEKSFGILYSHTIVWQESLSSDNY